MRRLTTAVALTAIVAAAAVFRAVLGAGSHTPKVLGDELIYSGLAKGWAFHGRPLVRGVSDVGHSTLYALLVAPVFRWSADGASALATVRIIDAVVMALTAIPAYLLARRVVSHGWALGVAALSVAAPWTAYSALLMTESFFYPAFVTFASVLVWTLERPTPGRQAAMLAVLAVVVGVRAQGLTVALGAVAAILLCRQARRFAPTFGALGLVLAFGVAAKLAGVAIPTSSYDAVFNSLGRIGRIVEWAAWNLGSLELASGVVALVALPVAVRGMLRRGAPAAVRTTAIVTVTLGGSLLASVALLSAGPYGLGLPHERSLFYTMPLVLTCLAHWLRGGLERPRRLAAGGAAAGVGFVAWLPHSLGSTPNNVDALSTVLFRGIDAHALGTFRLWTSLAAVAGAAVFLVARRPWLPILTLVVAFAALTVRVDYSDALTASQTSDLAWVDHALPAGATATLVYLGVPASGAPCGQVAAAEQQDFTIWTEFLNDKVDDVVHVYDPNPRDGLASPELTVGTGGVILEDGKPYAPPYLVIDSRQRVVGSVLARFDVASLHGAFENGASLTLWRVTPPLRFLPRPAALPPRGDGLGC